MLFDHLKKPAILAASLALAVGIAPMAAFAAEGDLGDVELTAQEDIVTGMTPINVDKIDLTITQPVAGESSTEKPQATTTTEGVEILSDNNHWVESDGGNMLSTTFVEGETYDAMIQLVLEQGYQIAGGNIRALPVNVTNGTLNSIDEGYDSEHPAIIELWIKTKAVAAGAPAANPATTPAEEPSATTEPAAAAATASDTKAAAADSDADTTVAATTTTISEAGTMPKTADTLPVALLGTLALMSAITLAMAFRLRKN